MTMKKVVSKQRLQLYLICHDKRRDCCILSFEGDKKCLRKNTK